MFVYRPPAPFRPRRPPLWVPSVVYALTETFSDDFDDNSIDTAKWTTFESGSGSITETGQRMEITVAAGAGNDFRLFSRNFYNLTGSYVRVDVPSVGTEHANNASLLQVKIGGTSENRILVHENNSVLFFQYILNNGGANGTSVAYNATDHRWWRIRESGGNILWDTSPDGSNWTNQRTVASPFAENALRGATIQLSVTTTGAAATGRTTVFDSLNIGAYTQTLTGTLTSSGALVNATSKIHTGELTSSGALTNLRTFPQSLAGTLTSAGTLVNTAAKALAGTLTSSGTHVKSVSQVRAGTLTSAGAIVKAIAKLFTGTLTSSGSESNVLTQPPVAYTQTLTGNLTFTGSMCWRIKLPLSSKTSGTLSLTQKTNGTLTLTAKTNGTLSLSAKTTGSLSLTDKTTGTLALVGNDAEGCD